MNKNKNENSFNAATSLTYYIFSDVHGEYDALQRALKKSGYNPKDKNSYLVSLGDAFDRGVQSFEVLKWMVENIHAHKLLTVCGNHELRFQELMENPTQYHRESDGLCNGVIQTMMSFCHMDKVNVPLVKESAAKIALDMSYSLSFFCDLVHLMPSNISMMLAEYFYNLEWGFQNKDYILVHGWFAHKGGLYITPETSVWANTPECIKAKDYPADGRKLIIGHFATETLKEAYEANIMRSSLHTCEDFISLCETFECDKFIALDGSTNASGKVNIYVLKTNEPLTPIKYDKTQN